MEKRFHVLIVGGGVVGCFIARELSRYVIHAALLEKGSDVCGGASKANSGVVHSGIYSQPGSEKARLCVEGNRLFPGLCEEIGVEFQRIGKLVLARDESEIPKLERLKEVGEQNGVPDIVYKEEEELKKLEPKIKAERALWVPWAGIVSPYGLTITLAENALVNDVQIFLDTEVMGISQSNGFFKVNTNQGSFEAKYVINCAGVHCDAIARMVGIDRYTVYPCRGEYLILDKSYGNLINHLIYPPPQENSGGLGIHLTPTIEGNILVGPSARYIQISEDTITTGTYAKELISEVQEYLGPLPRDAVISSYAGIRCKLVAQGSNEPGDFIIREEKDVPNFINLMGIESPGLSASPAIAREVVNLIAVKEDLEIKKEFKVQIVRTRLGRLDLEDRVHWIQSNPKYGHAICRCEHVSEQEIIDALNNPLDVRTMAGIKYRTRATMGRCQGGFCRPRIVRILEEQFNLDMRTIKFRGKDSHLFIGRTKDLRKHDTKEP